MESKFQLPSPNFTKKFNKSNKSYLHYLTPSGMTLLPREKQPPPMYGWHGSTVPPKYLKVEKQQNMNVTTIASNRSPPRTEYCDNCNMELATAQDMRRHLNQHQSCPAEECSFTALSFVMEQHIEANHITGLYKRVRKVWTPQNIAAWRAERCKRFPTVASVKIAKQAKEQRLKRGERLEASNRRFGISNDRQIMRSRLHTRKRNSPKEIKNGRDLNTVLGKSDHHNEKLIGSTMQNPSNSQSGHVSIFRGTSKMIDYKHVTLKTKNKLDNALSEMLRVYETDSESENEASDDNIDVTAAFVDHKITIDEQETDLAQTVLRYAVMPLVDDINADESTKIRSSSSDEGPDDVPIERNNKPILTAKLDLICPIFTTKLKQTNGKNTMQTSPKERSCGLNYTRACQFNNQNTMLSKLLEREIRHERNVLLQCVRYVCENNFFDLK